MQLPHDRSCPFRLGGGNARKGGKHRERDAPALHDPRVVTGLEMKLHRVRVRSNSVELRIALRAPRKIASLLSGKYCWPTRFLAATGAFMATGHPAGQTCWIFLGALETIWVRVCVTTRKLAQIWADCFRTVPADSSSRCRHRRDQASLHAPMNRMLEVRDAVYDIRQTLSLRAA